MSGNVELRPARPDEARALSALALRSKAHWGYTAEFMEACREELTLAPEEVEVLRAVVAEFDGAIVGYYALEDLSRTEVELEALFVEPAFIGRGIGRALFDHAVRASAGRGATALFIQSDPEAEGFYRRVGARVIGHRASASIPGRVLPLLAIDVVPLGACV